MSVGKKSVHCRGQHKNLFSTVWKKFTSREASALCRERRSRRPSSWQLGTSNLETASDPSTRNTNSSSPIEKYGFSTKNASWGGTSSARLLDEQTLLKFYFTSGIVYLLMSPKKWPPEGGGNVHSSREKLGGYSHSWWLKTKSHQVGKPWVWI